MRRCIFCGMKASTGEDVWPLWLMNRFPTAGTASMGAEVGGRSLGNWPTQRPRLLLKKLCQLCNNGWMSQLETEVKPVVESILDDRNLTLDAFTQETLAQWAVKTAMVLDAVDSDRQGYYSQHDREQMRCNRSLPVRTSVWIAKCVDQPNIYSAAKHHWSENGVHALCTTMAFGALALQVVTIKAPVTIPAHIAVTYDVREGPWNEILVQMWPIDQQIRRWPPSHGLAGVTGLEVLTERLTV